MQLERKKGGLGGSFRRNRVGFLFDAIRGWRAGALKSESRRCSCRWTINWAFRGTVLLRIGIFSWAWVSTFCYSKSKVSWTAIYFAARMGHRRYRSQKDARYSDSVVRVLWEAWVCVLVLVLWPRWHFWGALWLRPTNVIRRISSCSAFVQAKFS
jgi:hypothetical protein